MDEWMDGSMDGQLLLQFTQQTIFLLSAVQKKIIPYGYKGVQL